jgi:uncharacterized protein (TIGR02145 family)
MAAKPNLPRMKNLIKFLGLNLISISIVLNSCKKEESSITITDIDGNIYNTVTIGTQVWMKENLKVTKYCNGDLIGTTIPLTLFLGFETTPKYQWAYDGNEINVNTYGRLYTWYAVTDSRNICPTGWHVPTLNEWHTLINYLGGQNIAGGKLKDRGLSHWRSPNTGATNVSNFTALPGGCRDYWGPFAYIGDMSFWWSSTETETNYVYSLNVYYYQTNVNIEARNKIYGISVRCIKD